MKTMNNDYYRGRHARVKLTFCVMYFQGHALLHGRSVLAPEDFFRLCILPLFSLDRTNRTDIYLKDVLHLLLTTVQSRDDVQWMSDNEIFAIMLCLCEIADEYKIKKARDETSISFDVEDIAVSCLSYAEKSVLHHRSGRTGIFITARIPKECGSTVSAMFVYLFTPRGYPITGQERGYPHPVLMGGTPCQPDGVTPLSAGWWYRPVSWMGVPPVSWMAVPPCWDWMG